MRFAAGSVKRLKGAELDTEDIAAVLARLEAAVPHLHFGSWRVRIYDPRKAIKEEDRPMGEALWKDRSRLNVEVILNLSAIRLLALCHRDAGALPPDEYEFLIRLADESASAIESKGNTPTSLFDFGTVAVAKELRRRVGLKFDPLEILRFVRSLSQETYENQRLSYGLIFLADQAGA